MRHYNIQQKYSPLTNAELNHIITQFKANRPESSVHYVIGYLQRQGYRVQFHRVLHSLRCLDHLGQILWSYRIKKRGKYYVKRPNALWHIDGHHKLIRWGIVIHGAVDGFCRTV